MLFIVNVLMIFVSVAAVLGETTLNCFDAYSCAFSSISDNSSNSIECDGFYSCYSASLIQSTYSGNIGCVGSYSCFNASSIEHTNTFNAGSIECGGLYSCAFVNNIYNMYGTISCDGELSCTNSNISIMSNNFLWCNGDRSCANTLIKSDEESVHFFYGHLSAYNSILYGNGHLVTYYFYGTMSGYNTSIICDIGSTCVIVCYSNACSNIKLLTCSDSNNNNNNNCTLDIDCSNGEKSIICPNGYSINININNNKYNFSLPSLINTRMSDMNNSIYPCTDTQSINCANYEECSNNGVILNKNGSICCTAAESCDNSTNITSLLGNIRLDGWFSSQVRSYYNNYYYIASISGGSVYLSGGYATGNDDTNGIIEAKQGNIYATASDAAWKKVFLNSNNLYCNGYYSCFTAIISNINNNIYSYGYAATNFAVINNVNGSIYCGTTFSCSYDVISNVNGSVYGFGKETLYSGTISNVSNTVAGFGTNVLSNAKITNATQVKSSFIIYIYRG